MTSGTKYKQGDIVLAPFPFTDLSQSKLRTALVISNRSVNNTPHDNVFIPQYWLIPISSTQTDQDDAILFSDQDKQMVTFHKPCAIKPWAIFTLDERLIQKSIGHITPATLQAVIAFIHHATERQAEQP